ncbi:type IV secretion protein Rhs [Enterobacter cloacae]|uniref:type IV secretion protein Rhs n=1 Tax=Enterobacter cloacae TaxID=550 RepID=UPI002A83BAA0|nr:type IV secretion protein Rhs [Enterobacter cloacae]
MKYVLSLLFLLCGCSPINTDLAKQYVSVFHELYQNGRYSDIYKGASPDFQKATSEEKFISIMVDAKEKLLGLLKKQPLNLSEALTAYFQIMKYPWCVILNIQRELFRKFLYLRLKMEK